MVIEAVAALQGNTGATVNQVAAELGLDQSGASPMLGQAAERGYLRKIALGSDARQRRHLVTEEGGGMLDSAHE